SRSVIRVAAHTYLNAWKDTVVEQALLPPEISSAVLLDAINGDEIDDMSLGQLSLAKAFFGQKLSERLADPDSVDELATFQKAAGADWSGHGAEFGPAGEGPSSKPAPIPPQNSEDTIHGMLLLLVQHERSTESDLANFVRKLEFGLKDQSTYFGVPEGIQGFSDAKDVLRQTTKMSSVKANKIIDRAKYFTYGSNTDRTAAGASPKLPKMAAAFIQGLVPTENLDRAIAIDHDVTKYAREVGKTPEYAGEVLQAIEPLILEAAESVTTEGFSREKHRCLEKIAHHVDSDGPPPPDVLRKKADNALRMSAHDDESETASGGSLRGFLNTSLNCKGNTPRLPHNIDNLYKAAADAKAGQAAQEASDTDAPAEEQPSEQPSAEPQQHPTELDEVVAEDAEGNTYTTEEISTMDRLSRAERAGAILLGALYSVMSMSPQEATAKTAHGSPAKLVIVQDIQTAYSTLGLPALPEAVRRPDGPDGILPTVIRRPNPDNPNAPNFIEHTGSDDIFTGHVNPVP